MLSSQDSQLKGTPPSAPKQAPVPVQTHYKRVKSPPLDEPPLAHTTTYEDEEFIISGDSNEEVVLRVQAPRPPALTTSSVPLNTILDQLSTDFKDSRDVPLVWDDTDLECVYTDAFHREGTLLTTRTIAADNKAHGTVSEALLIDEETEGKDNGC